MRTLNSLLALSAFLLATAGAAAADGPGGAAGSAPLAALPSAPGPHVARIRAMGDDSWQDLGKPAPDPKWGSARGRSWTAKMAWAPDLRAAFLFGEGRHGWWDEASGRYMDDLWAYDVNGHRWVCVRPGADVRNLDLRLNEAGVEVDRSGEPVPVAQMVHGYEGTDYDPDRHRFLFMPCSGGYWEAAMGKRRMAWLKGDKHNEVAKNCSPWAYDVRADKWDRRPTAAPAPTGGFGDVLIHVPAVGKVFLRTAGVEVWWYDPAGNAWAQVKQKGPPPPFGIDPTACYDTKRDRIYVGGGSYPVAPAGSNALWAYDVKTDTWIDPKPAGACCGGSNSYNSNVAVMTYDEANDVVVLTRYTDPDGDKSRVGVWVYDPAANAWSRHPFPEGMAWKGQVNGFYDTELNAHFYHVAGDSEPEGSVRVYRWKAKDAGPK